MSQNWFENKRKKMKTLSNMICIWNSCCIYRKNFVEALTMELNEKNIEQKSNAACNANQYALIKQNDTKCEKRRNKTHFNVNK